MLVVFAATGIVASLLMVAGVHLYPPGKGVTLPTEERQKVEPVSPADRIVEALTVPDFVQLLSKKRLPALIIFAVLVGLAAGAAGDKTKPFAD